MTASTPDPLPHVDGPPLIDPAIAAFDAARAAASAALPGDVPAGATDDAVLADPDEDGEPGPSDMGQDGVDPAVVAACALLDHSDTDNGQRLLAHFGADLAVLAQDEITDGAWLAWAGTHWDLAGGRARAQVIASRVGGRIGLEVAHLARSPAEVAAIDAAAHLDRFADGLTAHDKHLIKQADAAEKLFAARQKARRNHAVTSKNAARIEKMLQMSGPHLRRAADRFNVDPMRVATTTHTLVFAPDQDVSRPYCIDARAGHDRADYLTASVPHAWCGLDAAAPKFEAFMAQMLPDPDTRRTVQQYAGAGLLGTPLQYVMFHYGHGANGKSVFLETISRVLGPGLAVELPREALVGTGDRGAGAASPDLARLYGKRLVRVAELKAGAPLQEDLIKRLTGGERFPVRSLFKGYFDFQNCAKPHMSGNGFPSIDGTDDGIWRRMIVVHWPVTVAAEARRPFEAMVSEFVDQEASGILAWLARGALDLLNHSLVLSDAIRAATGDYKAEMDQVGEFAAACVRPLVGSRVQAKALYEAYVAWATANGKRVRSQTKVGSDMKHHANVIKTMGINYYIDVALENVPAAARNPNDPD